MGYGVKKRKGEWRMYKKILIIGALGLMVPAQAAKRDQEGFLKRMQDRPWPTLMVASIVGLFVVGQTVYKKISGRCDDLEKRNERLRGMVEASLLRVDSVKSDTLTLKNDTQVLKTGQGELTAHVKTLNTELDKANATLINHTTTLATIDTRTLTIAERLAKIQETQTGHTVQLKEQTKLLQELQKNGAKLEDIQQCEQAMNACMKNMFAGVAKKSDLDQLEKNLSNKLELAGMKKESPTALLTHTK